MRRNRPTGFDRGSQKLCKILPTRGLLTGHENHDRVLFVGVHCRGHARVGECPGNSSPATARAAQRPPSRPRDPAGAARSRRCVLEKTRFSHARKDGRQGSPGQITSRAPGYVGEAGKVLPGRQSPECERSRGQAISCDTRVETGREAKREKIGHAAHGDFRPWSRWAEPSPRRQLRPLPTVTHGQPWP